MGKDPKEKLVIHTRESETKRTSHWWFSKRGPAFLDPLVHIGDHSIGVVKAYLSRGQVIADIGCGWGYYAFKLADLVGPEGKVYAVDMAEKCIVKLKKKTQRTGYRNIMGFTSTAADIAFIADESVNFVYANGLLCSMAFERQLALSEIRRIIKPTGKIYLSLGATPPMGYVDEEEWNATIEQFNLIQGGSYKQRWALVSVI